jgi:Flp pilus assembly protein TadG
MVGLSAFIAQPKQPPAIIIKLGNTGKTMKTVRSTTTGSSMLELVCGLMIMVPLILLVIDLAFMYEGASQNKTICREAARAAASGPPNAVSPGTPQKRADAVAQPYQHTTGPFRFATNCVVKENVLQPLPEAPYGGPVAGEVTVETTVHVSPPFIVRLICESKDIRFVASETFPYTYTMPSTMPSTMPNTEIATNASEAITP